MFLGAASRPTMPLSFSDVGMIVVGFPVACLVTAGITHNIAMASGVAQRSGAPLAKAFTKEHT